jgi:uncharacterized protein YyaL (SSP411 family)
LKPGPARKTNRLGNERSPYLLQHASNPVDWYPWGEEAIALARRENKPIFLSIGYSSCHWCHVMERESFEDESIANILNTNFVSMKVDREERPDLDELYMKAVMALTGSGGWPLTVFLTPDLEPFYGGTYFPPVSRQGMPGLPLILRRISEAWKSDRENIVNSASQIKAALSEMFTTKADQESKINDGVFDSCYEVLDHEYDRQFGGFGASPKFPTPSNLFFLLRYHVRTGEKGPLQMVTKTLDFMASGGIYDHVGGGFHRYSTDREWIIPHFEKMLYDNALLAIAYTEAYQITRDDRYKTVVIETLSWVLREMTAELGGFYSSQDADTQEGEGSYYAWDVGDFTEALAEWGKLNGKEMEPVIDATLNYFGIDSRGNFENGKTILTTRVVQNELEPKKDSGLSEVVLEHTKTALLEFRRKRPRPLTDDKILSGWNGLMISAMARAYKVFGNESFIGQARRAADFVLQNMTLHENEKLSLARRYRKGETKENAVLEDYAFFINALLDLYEAIFESKYLVQAVHLCETMIRQFYDSQELGFFMSQELTQDLFLRPKDAYDGALPSGNSSATLALLRLSEMTSRDDYRKKAQETFSAFWSAISNQPASHTFMMVALDFMLSKIKEIVLSGERNSTSLKEMIQVLFKRFLPSSVIIFAEPQVANLAPIVEGRISQEGEQSKVYVCSNHSCKLPSSTIEELLKALQS